MFHNQTKGHRMWRLEQSVWGPLASLVACDMEDNGLYRFIGWLDTSVIYFGSLALLRVNTIIM